MTPSRPQISPPWHVTAFMLIALLDLSLRFFGFARAVTLARRLAGGRAVLSGNRQDMELTASRVVTASIFYPGRSECLEQSLALYVLLRRRGIAVELKLGVQPYPFSAHAWVELNGQPVNERPETIRQFVPLPDFAL